MNIALIGATGFVGQAVLAELLARGHQVKALVRSEGKLAPQNGLTTVVADVMQASQVADAVRGADVVVSAFNAGWTNPNLYDDFLAGSRAIVQGVKSAGVARLLVVGGAGSLFVAPGVQLVDTPEFPAAIRPGAAAARDALKELQAETALDWTFLSPPIGFHPGGVTGKTGQYRLGRDEPLMQANGQPGEISPEDLAVAIADEVAQHRHPRQRFTVAY